MAFGRHSEIAEGTAEALHLAVTIRTVFDLAKWDRLESTFVEASDAREHGWGQVRGSNVFGDRWAALATIALDAAARTMTVSAGSPLDAADCSLGPLVADSDRAQLAHHGGFRHASCRDHPRSPGQIHAL